MQQRSLSTLKSRASGLQCLVDSIAGFYTWWLCLLLHGWEVAYCSEKKSHLTHWGRDEIDGILKCIFLNANILISINISLKFIPKGPINNIPTLVQIMVWRRPGDKPLSEPMMVSLLTHICVTRPQWVNYITDSAHIITPVSPHANIDDTINFNLSMDK